MDKGLVLKNKKIIILLVNMIVILLCFFIYTFIYYDSILYLYPLLIAIVIFVFWGYKQAVIDKNFIIINYKIRPFLRNRTLLMSEINFVKLSVVNIGYFSKWIRFELKNSSHKQMFFLSDQDDVFQIVKRFLTSGCTVHLVADDKQSLQKFESLHKEWNSFHISIR